MPENLNSTGNSQIESESEKMLLPGKKLIAAPMATLSHEAFRKLIEKLGGCDEYFTEMINASSLLTNGPFEKYYVLNECAKEKIVWQLTGNSVSSMVKASELLAEKEGIGIDINMGCSAPQIYKTGAGITWMLKPADETKQLVSEIKKICIEKEKASGKHIRLSVKCRLGNEDFTEQSFMEFTDMLAENGVELISLHPRTLKEKYRGLPKFEYVQKLAEHFNGAVKVYANGGIFSVQDLAAVEKKCPSADGFMFARAAAQMPWIFSALKGNHGTIDCQELALEFIDNVEKYQPPEFVKTRLQRFFTYYCNNFSFAHYFQTQMLNSPSAEESRNRVTDYFTKVEADRYKNY